MGGQANRSIDRSGPVRWAGSLRQFGWIPLLGCCCLHPAIGLNVFHSCVLRLLPGASTARLETNTSAVQPRKSIWVTGSVAFFVHRDQDAVNPVVRVLAAYSSDTNPLGRDDDER